MFNTPAEHPIPKLPARRCNTSSFQQELTQEPDYNTKLRNFSTQVELHDLYHLLTTDYIRFQMGKLKTLPACPWTAPTSCCSVQRGIPQQSHRGQSPVFNEQLSVTSKMSQLWSRVSATRYVYVKQSRSKQYNTRLSFMPTNFPTNRIRTLIIVARPQKARTRFLLHNPNSHCTSSTLPTTASVRILNKQTFMSLNCPNNNCKYIHRSSIPTFSIAPVTDYQTATTVRFLNCRTTRNKRCAPVFLHNTKNFR